MGESSRAALAPGRNVEEVGEGRRRRRARCLLLFHFELYFPPLFGARNFPTKSSKARGETDFFVAVAKKDKVVFPSNTNGHGRQAQNC